MGRANREGARRRSLGLAVSGVGVLAVAAALVWPISSQHRGVAYAQASAGVIPLPSADEGAAASYWQARLGAPSAGALPRPQDSGSAGAGQLATPLLPSPTAVGTGAAAGPELSGAAQAAAQGPPMAVSNPLSSTPFTGVPQVGALFGTADGSIANQGHYCSGSVVNTPQGDIVLTAAHCVYDANGAYTDIAFVPGYHGGQDPYGVWTPSAVVVPPQWASNSDPDYDVAFLVVHEAGSTARIQDVVGGDQLGLNPAYPGLTQVIGYPSTAEQPITCTNQTRQVTDPSLSTPQLEFDCANYPGGTSGGPFLRAVDANTGLGTVVGMIGGFQAGGNTPDVSYSSYFGNWVGSLLAEAEAQAG